MTNDLMYRKGARNRAYIRMRNGHPTVLGIQYFLIVEGESDVKLFNKFLNHSECIAVTICDFDKGSNDRGSRARNAEEGKSNKEEVIKYIKEQNGITPGLLGIVDADFDHLTGGEELPDNIIVTDCHDIEMVIIKSQPDLSSLYAEIADPYLINNYEAKSEKIIDLVITIAYEIGMLRLACSKLPKTKRPSTKDLEYLDCIDGSFKITMPELITRTVKGSLGKSIVEQEIIDSISFEKAQNHDKYQVCCGHDVTNILSHCFDFTNSKFQFGGKERLTKPRIESLLRLVYRPESFQMTDIYKSILEWQKMNKKILDPNIFPD